MTDARRAVHALVSGRVQHVGFRWYVERRATTLGLGGWVRNTADGDVEVTVAGAAESVAQLIEALHHGPAHARVDHVRVTELAADREAVAPTFEILP